MIPALPRPLIRHQAEQFQQVTVGMKGYAAIADWVKDVPPPMLADLCLRGWTHRRHRSHPMGQPVYELGVSPFSAHLMILKQPCLVNGHRPGSCQNCRAGHRISVVGRFLEIAPFLTAKKEAGDCNSGAVGTFCRVTSVRSLA
jgi:hypothetical protein